MSKQREPRAKRKPPFSIRLTDAERAQLESQAGGMPLGSYIKSIVLADDAPRYRAKRKPPVEDQKLLAEILARLGASRSSSNLNQIAKALHLGTLSVDPNLEDNLNRACAEVAWIRRSLMQALGLKPDSAPAASRLEPQSVNEQEPMAAPRPRKVRIVSSFAKTASKPEAPVPTAPSPAPIGDKQTPTEPTRPAPPSRFQWRKEG